jgi:hypothetical protein
VLLIKPPGKKPELTAVGVEAAVSGAPAGTTVAIGVVASPGLGKVTVRDSLG